MAEFRKFQENLKEWIVEPPIPDRLTILGSTASSERRSRGRQKDVLV
ncbi:hypothetical protein OG979_34710 [Actinomadura citrea]|nr:hypothetical protein [Actinomadura citrea]